MLSSRPKFKSEVQLLKNMNINLLDKNNNIAILIAGVLASFNFVGYLSGAIFAVFIKDINTVS